MKRFMVDIDFLGELDFKFWQLIPAQRRLVNGLMKNGVISDYSLSIDRQKLWVVINADKLKEVKAVIESFPIRDYISYNIYSLLFHERNSISVPQLWLN